MRPIILDYATERIGDYKEIYEYNDLLSLNVIKVNDDIIPFIDVSDNTVNFTTVTKVVNESNTEFDGYNLALLEMKTKTLVRQESDD